MCPFDHQNALGPIVAVGIVETANNQNALGPILGVGVVETANNQKALGPLAAAEQDILGRSARGFAARSVRGLPSVGLARSLG